MRVRSFLSLSALLALGTLTAAQPPKRLNAMIDLMAAGKPVFGLYAPSNRRFQGAQGARGAQGAGAQSAQSAPAKTAGELAAEAMANDNTDFIFDGSMEGGMERALPAFTNFVRGMAASGSFKKRTAS
jgi:hypothetical protein